MQFELHPAGEARNPGSSAHGLTPALSGEARRAGRRPGRRGSSVCSGLFGSYRVALNLMAGLFGKAMEMRWSWTSIPV